MAGPRGSASRRARPARAGPLGLAAARLHAHRADPAADAGPGRHPRLGDPAARRRLAQDLPLAGAAPAAHPRLRPPGALLGLRLPVVLRDLPAADGLAGGLHPAALDGLLAGAPGRPARRAAPADPAARPRDVRPGRGARRRARARREGAERGAATGSKVGDDWVAAERGYLREAGNLVFHISVLVVLLGFAMGSLFGYRGGAIVLVGGGFSNNLTQYDDFVPGQPLRPGRHGALLLRRGGLRHRVAHERPGPGTGAVVRLAPDLPDQPAARSRRTTTSRSTTRWRSATPRSS